MIPNITSITRKNVKVPVVIDSVDVVRPLLIRPSLLLLLSSSAVNDPNAENVPSVLCVVNQLSVSVKDVDMRVCIMLSITR